MPQYCCVPQCTSNKGGHKFPTDPQLQLKWRVAVKRVDERTKKLWMPGPHDVVCRDHFVPQDYAETLLGKFYSYLLARGSLQNIQRHRLRQNPYPDLNLTLTLNLSLLTLSLMLCCWIEIIHSYVEYIVVSSS